MNEARVEGKKLSPPTFSQQFPLRLMLTRVPSAANSPRSLLLVH